MSKSPSKKKKTATMRQKIAAKHLLENGGSVGDAMRVANYSPAMVKNPDKLTKSKGFIAILEGAGVTDEALAAVHAQQLQSARIETYNFDAIASTEELTHNPVNGRKLRNPVTKTVYKHVPDKQIKEQIESVPGHILMYIQKGGNRKVAYVRVPENVVRNKAIEMGYKVKTHFSAGRLDVVHHNLTPEESEALLGLNQEDDEDQ